MAGEYKELMIKNETSYQVTLFLYPRWIPVSWVSSSSKIIYPGDKFLHRDKEVFKFKIRAKKERNQKKSKWIDVTELKKWKENKIITIFERDEPVFREDVLTEDNYERRICVRAKTKDEQIKVGEGRDLYALLKLDMKEIRGKPKEEQDALIRKAYHKEILRWHPDHHEGDDHFAKEIIFAYDILSDPVRRTEYNNMTDYDCGWLSRARWRSMFRPECINKEQKLAYRKRLGFMALSVGIFVGGVVLTALTAGAAAPAAVIAGGVLGAGMTGAGMQSGLRTMKREAIANGVDWKKYLASASIGCLTGSAFGGIAVGCAAGFVGIGESAIQASQITWGQSIATTAIPGAAGGILISLGHDGDRAFIDGQNLSLKQVAGHAVGGCLMGAGAGIAGGAVAKIFHTAPTAAADLQGDGIEQAVTRVGANPLGRLILRNVSRGLTENAAATILDSSLQVIEERLDDSLENQPITKHAKNCGKTLVYNVATESVKGVAAALMEHQKTKSRKAKVNTNLEERTDSDLQSTQPDTQGVSENTSTDMEGQCSDEKSKAKFKGRTSLENTTVDLEYQENNDHNSNRVKAEQRHIFSYKGPEFPGDQRSNEIGRPIVTTMGSSYEDPCPIRYICKRSYKIKMIIDYRNQAGISLREEVSSSGRIIKVPHNATFIRVQFQVLRFINMWCDVKKYHRFEKFWWTPSEQHIFWYRSPVERTFTLDGPLYAEAVVQVTDGNYDEVEDM